MKMKWLVCRLCPYLFQVFNSKIFLDFGYKISEFVRSFNAS